MLVGDVRRLVAGRELGHDFGHYRPEICDSVTALRGMLSKMRRSFTERFDLRFDIDPLLGQAPPETGTATFWIVHEAIINVLKHARATHCWVSIDVVDDELWVRVRDDGIGLLPKARTSGSGTSNMTERARERGGWCAVQPAQPQGVLVVACLPMG
jgi:signal transduction histidine kinase